MNNTEYSNTVGHSL